MWSKNKECSKVQKFVACGHFDGIVPEMRGIILG